MKPMAHFLKNRRKSSYARIKELEAEIARLNALLLASRSQAGEEEKLDDRVRATVDWLRETGASQSEIDEFLVSVAA